MSYLYTPVYPTAADVAALATQLAQRQSDAGTTNGGITASGGSATVPQLGVDSPGLGIAYLKAMADSILCAVGFQAQNVDSSASTTYGTNSYANIWGAYTFNAPIAKTYLVHVDVTAFASLLSGGLATAAFRLLMGGSTAVNLWQGNLSMISTVPYYSASWRAPYSFPAGNTTIQLQWNAVRGTIGVDGNCSRVITVTG